LETRGREIEQTQGRDGTERKQRERDAVIATLVLAQAAAEGYANWAHIHAGTPVDGQSWVERWQKLPAAAEAMGRPVGATLADPQCDFLNLLGAWRNRHDRRTLQMGTAPDRRPSAIPRRRLGRGRRVITSQN
jgi:hypothetical protein